MAHSGRMPQNQDPIEDWIDSITNHPLYESTACLSTLALCVAFSYAAFGVMEDIPSTVASSTLSPWLFGHRVDTSARGGDRARADWLFGTHAEGDLAEGASAILSGPAKQLERQPWAEAAFRRAVLERRPALFEGSPTRQWGAFERWTPEKLRRGAVGGTVLADVIGGKLHWNFDSAKPLCAGEGGLPRAACHRDTVHNNVSVASFLDRLAAREPLLYLSPLGYGDEWDALAADVGWGFALEPLAAEEPEALARGEGGGDTGPLAGLSQSQVLQYVWIGGGGVTTATHYDTSHNCFAQIAGQKRFVLRPPSAAREQLRLHSVAHPGHRKAMDGGLDTHGGATVGAGALVANLRRGDLLYLPPLWFHTVTSEAGAKGKGRSSAAPEVSISSSVWAGSSEGKAFDDAMLLPLPDAVSERSNPNHAKLLASFMAAIVGRTIGQSRIGTAAEVRALVRRAVICRYGADFGGCELVPRDKACQGWEQPSEAAAEFRRYVNAIGDALAGGCHLQRGSAVSRGQAGAACETIIGNYLEHVAHSMMGGPRQGCRFFAECF